MSKSMLPLLLVLAVLIAGAFAQDASRDSSYKGPKGSGKGFQDVKVGLLNEYAKLNKVEWKKVSETLGDDSYKITYAFGPQKGKSGKDILADFQAWQYKQPTFVKLDQFSLKAKGSGASTDKAGKRLARKAL